jgi:DNA-binding SARP family transcriptional activator
VSPLRICLFGTPRVEKDGQSILIPRRKIVALLAYLAVTGQMHSREALATLFWPDHDQSGALANLRRQLSHLKDLFGEENVLSADRLQVGLASGVEIQLDVADFKRLVNKARAHGHELGTLCADCSETLREAVEIYRGEFMAGFNIPDSPGFEEWRFFQGEELRQLLADSLPQLIDSHESRAEYEQSIAYARRWLALDRLHEPAHRSLMQLYARSGQQAAALRQFQECRRILQEELGLEPEEQTRALYEEIRSRTFGSPGRSVSSPASSLKIRSGAESRLSQTVRFCNTPDGVRLAYAIIGEGPVLVKAANWLSHLDYDWNSPVWRHWLTGLAERNTLIRYDERGCGLSDWNVNEFTLEAWITDLETVVEAMGLERFPLLGISQGASIAVEYAVRHPEQVSCLILYGGYIRGRLQRDLAPRQKEELDVMLQLIKIGWGQEHEAFRQVFSSLFLPEGTPEQLHAFNELQRVTSTN